MSSRPEFKALASRTEWLSPTLRRSLRWALHGPWWLPVRVRRLPLDAVAVLYRRELRRLRDGL